jgi:hypothetical protein
MILGLILAIIGLVIIGLLFIRIKHFGKKIRLIILAALLVFLIISVNSTIRSGDTKLDSFGGYLNMVSSYLGWLVDFGKDSIKFTGNIIKNLSIGFGK